MKTNAARKVSTPTASLAEVFQARVEARADLVRGYYLELPDAVDGLQKAANDYGLVEEFGQDWVQAMMAEAFASKIIELAPATSSFSDTKTPHAAGSTVEALMFSLRERGTAALLDRDCRRRLADMSTTQIRGVIARLIVLRPRYPSITDDLLYKLGQQL